jgi:hypothetical protein
MSVLSDTPALRLAIKLRDQLHKNQAEDFAASVKDFPGIRSSYDSRTDAWFAALSYQGETLYCRYVYTGHWQLFVALSDEDELTGIAQTAYEVIAALQAASDSELDIIMQRRETALQTGESYPEDVQPFDEQAVVTRTFPGQDILLDGDTLTIRENGQTLFGYLTVTVADRVYYTLYVRVSG